MGTSDMSVLITGGTGSFGRAFAKHLLAQKFDRVCIYSRGEHAQAHMRAELEDDPRLRWFIGDVRDRDRLRRAMEGCFTVIHAAALKRIEVGAYNPIEMVKTNVMGAINVIEAAQDAGVLKVVALSTDKAFQPVSPYGHSKAMAESLFLQADYARAARGPRFTVTRYGNVWWSAGSVGPLWLERIKRRQPIVVTDPDCTRFFMRMSEAVQLVFDAMDWAEGGDLRIPRDLPAYRVGDLLTAMLKPGDRAQIQQAGLPPHEKLHESMCEGLSSDKARRMTVRELRGEISRA